MRCWWWLGLLGAAAVLVSERASAQEVVSPPSDSVKAVRRWYGWQTLAVDGAALGVAVGGFAIHESEVPLVVGAGAYAIGAPIVHLAHREPWRAAGSLGLHLGLPILVGDVVARIDPTRCPGHGEDDDHDCSEQLGRMGVGVAAAMSVASAVDAVLLGYKTEPVYERAVTWSPTMGFERPREGRFTASVGVVGTF